tara:strand:- start:213 stop:416 length:204 start_codon:yes stop_codon:yes gene_type:complete
MQPYDDRPIDRPSRSEMLWFLNSIIEDCEEHNLDRDGGMVDTAKREFHYLKKDWLMERKLEAKWRGW